MVDIDGLVVELCRKFLPNHSAGAFDDERLEFICDDAKVYLETTDLKFDVIILDLADPVDGEPSWAVGDPGRSMWAHDACGGVHSDRSNHDGCLSQHFLRIHVHSFVCG